MAPTAAAPLPESAGSEPADPTDFDAALLRVDPTAAPAVSALADQVVGEETNDLEAARLIQNHLRSGLYSYSLTLAPGGDPNDPISHFLATRRGYCVQFATAMVMMARYEGIPARMAVGFQPGIRQPDGSRVIRQADAHAWPELWISGLGWTRFEPTGGRGGGAPTYSQLDVGPTATEQSATGAPSVTSAPTPQSSSGRGWFDDLGALAPDLGRGALILLVLAVLMALVPWAGRRYREAGLREATSARERVEGQWQLLTRSLEDYGVDPPEQRSPREMGRHYSTSTKLDRRAGEALGRVTTTLERSRYAPDTVTSDKAETVMGRDVRTIIDAVVDDLPWNIRANSRLLPRTGLRYLRERIAFWRR